MNSKQTRKLLRNFEQLWKRSCVPVFDHLPGFNASEWQNDASIMYLSVADDLPDLKEAPASLRVSHVASANMIALYKVLSNQKIEQTEAERLVTEVIDLEISRVPGFIKRLSSWFMFSAIGQRFTKYFAEKSASMSDDQYRMEYRSLGRGSFGLNITNCAVCTLAKKQGVQEFIPTICKIDEMLSKEFGWGLRRTQTIAKGSKHCDFVFVAGGETDIEK